jgi:hypothetical protein
MSKKNKEFDAIITYIHEDFSHGFVKEISDFNKLDRLYISDKTIPSFKFIPDPETEPSVNQILRVRTKSNPKEVEIVENVYVGLKRSNSQITPLESKFYGNQGVVYITNPSAETETVEGEEILLAEFIFTEIPPLPKGKAEIKFIFSIDIDGSIIIELLSLNNGKKMLKKITNLEILHPLNYLN